MTQNIEQRTKAAVVKYEGAASTAEKLCEHDASVSTAAGFRKSFPKISREWDEQSDFLKGDWESESSRLKNEWSNDSSVLKESWNHERNELSTKSLGVKVWESGEIEQNLNQQRRWIDNHTYLPKTVPVEMTALGPDDNWIAYTADKSSILDNVFGRIPLELINGIIVTPSNSIYPKLSAFGVLWEIDNGDEEVIVTSFIKNVGNNTLVITTIKDITIVAKKVVATTYEHSSKQDQRVIDEVTGCKVFPYSINEYVSVNNNNVIPAGTTAIRILNENQKNTAYKMSHSISGNIEKIDKRNLTVTISGVKVYLSEINNDPFNGQSSSFGVKPGVVNSDRLQHFFDMCDKKGWIPYFCDGRYSINGNYKLPRYGIKGSSRFSVVFDIADETTGVVFTYNDIGDWGAGQGQIENITVTTNKICSASLFRVATPSRGFVFNNAALRVGTGTAVQLFDSYYINFSNMAFSGAWLGRLPENENERLGGFGVRVHDREINNIYWNKCDFKDLATTVAGVGNVFVGSNSLQFTSCAFERIGDVCLDARGFHAQFDSCYFEGLDQNQKINVNSNNSYHRNAIAIAGAGDLIFNNCLLNCLHVRTDDPNYAIFESVLNRIVFNSGSIGVPSDFSGTKLRNVNYSTRAVIVNNSCTGLTDISRGAYERPSQQHTNVYVDITSKSLIAASQLMADDTYAATTYRYKTYPSPVVYGFPHPVPFGLVDGIVINQYFTLSLKARQYRLNLTTRKIGWMDIDAVFVISPDCPDEIHIDDLNLKCRGDKSVFFDTENDLLGKLKVYRVTPDRTDMTSKYPFSYQIAMIGESGNDIPKTLTTEVEISCSAVDFNDGPVDLGFGIYQQLSHWTSYKPI